MNLLVEEIRPRTLARPRLEPPAQSNRRFAPEARYVALAIFLLDMAVGIYLAYGVSYVNGDALSRIAEAYYVFFSRQPHLAAIGMIWNPLPSLFVLPFVLVKPLFPAMVTRGIAGIIVTAVFEALGVAELSHILAGFGFSKAWRMVTTVLYALNPLILLYSSNGMSDVMLMTTYLGALNGLFTYAENRSLRSLIAAGLWLAVGFGVRYEAVPFAVCVGLGLVIGLWGRRPLKELESALIILATPIVYAGAMWIYFNWLIMKDPFYFANSPYGNAAQTSTGSGVNGALVRANHNLLGTVAYAGHFMLLFAPAALGLVVVLAYLFGRRRDPKAMVLLGALAGALALELALTYVGLLAEWDRYFMSYIPIGFVMVAFAFSKATTWWPRVRGVLMVAMVAVLVAGNVGTWEALKIPVLSHPDGIILQDAVRGRPVGSNTTYGYKVNPAVNYIDAHPNLRVLTDTFSAYDVVIEAKNPKQFVITSDLNFQSILHNPLGRVNAILVPAPVNTGALDAVNRAYPGLWAGHVRWTYLIKSFSGVHQFRLYGVLSNAP